MKPQRDLAEGLFVISLLFILYLLTFAKDKGGELSTQQSFSDIFTMLQKE